MGGHTTLNSAFSLFDHPLFVLLDLLLVWAVLFHALNGVRILLMDFGLGIQRHKLVFVACMAVAVVSLGFFAFKAFSYIAAHHAGGLGGSYEQPARRAAGRGRAAGRRRGHAGRLDRRTVDAGAGGMWAWLFQRVTAVVLIIGLITHLIATHIFGLGHLSYLNIGHRLSSMPSAWSTSACSRPPSSTA